jgi:hypothetical protein
LCRWLLPTKWLLPNNSTGWLIIYIKITAAFLSLFVASSIAALSFAITEPVNA